MLNPSISGGGPVIRHHLGTQQLTTSGTWTKAAALALPYLKSLSPADLAAVAVEIECVGGGGGGVASSGIVYRGGGWPGAVCVRTVLLSDLAASVAATVGDGGTAGADGGTTSFGTLVVAPGGLKGVASNSTTLVGITQKVQSLSQRCVPPQPGAVTDAAPSSPDGPAGGGFTYGANFGGNGGSSAPGTDRAAAGGSGISAVVAGASPHAGDGASASDSWSYGAGGGATVASNGRGGGGGAPGGGGGGGALVDGSVGGRGEIRLRYFIWRRP